MAQNLTRAFAAVVDRRRNERGLSLRGLAREAGLADTPVLQKLRADRSISLHDLEGFASAFDVRPSDLIAEAEKEITR